jgi:hypothetical protein
VLKNGIKVKVEAEDHLEKNYTGYIVGQSDKGNALLYIKNGKIVPNRSFDITKYEEM